ncbi:beta-ketoacyl-ACP synthase III [Tianweitania populi]|uniref:Beta-ketoacyl-ACP synthase III n=1 Tax=Tianweitania populi TaxID=1607949 RepID=A0A8J3GJ83_9HYPH|nr:beta-ketoacyl-ACP synthase III [Tianweitania populi]GHD11075.1 beta-ketoacyl-ACP synthase III [Tianweitania populi]
MKRVVISGIGAEIPTASISNDELVATFNGWVERENVGRTERGEQPLPGSTSAFIEHASGIRARRVLYPEGVLDIDRMAPVMPRREDHEVSIQSEFGAASARKALADAGRAAADVDMVICASSHLQRMYPAVGIEIQQVLGTSGSAIDLSLGCSSAAGGLHTAFNLVRSGAQKCVLVCTPELITGHLDFRDRQTHFIFGDASVSMVVEALEDGEEREGCFEVLDTRLWTQFSNNIRSNFGYLARLTQANPSVLDMEGLMITQLGNKVFKEVTHAGHEFIIDFLRDNGQTPEDIRRFWLHQANARMNGMILRLAFGRDVDNDRAPIVLGDLGNTAAAGVIVALDMHHRDMQRGDYGLICAFGAGYSIGGALLRRL